ncbi:MAG: YfiR family protein [Rhodospirillaceae bacterium]
MRLHPAAKRIARAALAGTACACLPPWFAPAVASEASPLEVAVKATYLYKFAPFVSWPPGARRNARSGLCIVGDAPFGETLERAVAGQSIEGRPIAVRRYAQADPAAPCMVMYLAGSPAEPVERSLEAMRGAPVLTVTDAARGQSGRGIIHFVLDEGKVRFEIDNRAATASGLTISSRLLGLAREVRRE